MKEKDSKEVVKKEKNTTNGGKHNASNPPSSSKEYMDKVIAKRKKVVTISVISVIVIIAILLFCTGFAFSSMTNSKIIKGITIDGIDVSGLDKQEAIKMLEEKVKDRQTSTVVLKYGEYTKEFPMEQLLISANIEETVDKAVGKGRNGNIIQNNFRVLKSNFKKTENIDLEVKYDAEALEKFIASTGVELPGIVQQYSYNIEEDELVINPGIDGIVIDSDKMKNDFKSEITDVSKNFPKEREIAVKQEQAQAIDIDKIYEEVHTAPQNAYIEEEPFKVVVDKDGIDFAITIEEAKAIVAEKKDEYVIPLKVTKAEITVADLGERAFPDRLATFTTRYNAGNYNRSTNLSVACGKINNYVIQPGETFSYNKVVGKRSIENGFREAHIFTSTGVEDGMGGGICQISSTLYNAVILSNLEIVERHNHIYDASYVAPGRDATVSYGSLDFKFKNPRKYPVKITAYISGGVATVSIYGIKEEGEPTVQFVATTTATIPYGVEEIPDPTLNEGERVTEVEGMNGYRSVAYKYLYYPDGRTEQIYLSSDTYKTITKKERVGTKKVAPAPHTHKYGAWVTTVEPTEAAEGKQERSCACGQKETKILPKLAPPEPPTPDPDDPPAPDPNAQ